MTENERAQTFLRALERHELAALVAHCAFRLVTVEIWFDATAIELEATGPAVVVEALEKVPAYDRDRIVDAFVHAMGGASVVRERPRAMTFAATDAVVSDSESLLPLLLVERAELISVGTGLTRIQDANDYFRARRKRIAAALARRGVSDPISYRDLWGWYHDYKDRLSTYSERREFVNELYLPVIELVVDVEAKLPPVSTPTGWSRVDRAMTKARDAAIGARHEEDFQTVGLL
jgi:hypothetical protein